MIHANTDAARHEVLDFFLAAFDDIDPNAVPTTVHDDLYARSWCNSAIRTAGGCWAPPSPAAHRSLPAGGDEEAWRVITAEAHAASTANTRQQTERLYVGPSLQLGWWQPNKSQARTQRICAIHESDRYSATRASR